MGKCDTENELVNRILIPFKSQMSGIKSQVKDYTVQH